MGVGAADGNWSTSATAGANGNTTAIMEYSVHGEAFDDVHLAATNGGAAAAGMRAPQAGMPLLPSAHDEMGMGLGLGLGLGLGVSLDTDALAFAQAQSQEGMPIGESERRHSL